MVDFTVSIFLQYAVGLRYYMTYCMVEISQQKMIFKFSVFLVPLCVCYTCSNSTLCDMSLTTCYFCNGDFFSSFLYLLNVC